jgi:hypothetical protein
MIDLVNRYAADEERKRPGTMALIRERGLVFNKVLMVALAHKAMRRYGIGLTRCREIEMRRRSCAPGRPINRHSCRPLIPRLKGGAAVKRAALRQSERSSAT